MASMKTRVRRLVDPLQCEPSRRAYPTVWQILAGEIRYPALRAPITILRAADVY